MVHVPAFKDEAETWVNGSHEALIDKQIFYDVQDIIAGRRKNIPNKFQTVRKEFPLRGFLICPQCGRTLTGSLSKGKTGQLFPYYHCSRGCKERHNAEKVNSSFANLLQSLQANPDRIKLYAAILKDKLKQDSTFNKSETSKINLEISKQKQRIQNAKILMLDGEFSVEEFKETKREIDETLSKLIRKAVQLNSDDINLDTRISDCVKLLSNIGNYYTERDTDIKQKIVSSIFPEKLIFDKNQSRTLIVNEAVSSLCNNNKPSGRLKKEKHTEFGVLSHRVESEGIEPSSKQGINKPSTYLVTF